MPEQPLRHLLTINTGSSSLKAALYDGDPDPGLEIAAHVERIGSGTARLRIADRDGATLVDEPASFADHTAALQALLAWLRRERPDVEPGAVGHRIVDG